MKNKKLKLHNDFDEIDPKVIDGMILGNNFKDKFEQATKMSHALFE